MKRKLFEAAQQVMRRAYAPYSKFPVGAAILADTGAIYTGCNVENVAYPAGLCAEAGAIAAMIAGGDTRISEIAVIATGEILSTPCGSCRQRIVEFCRNDTPIHICDAEGIQRTFTASEMLPYAFGPAHLERVRF